MEEIWIASNYCLDAIRLAETHWKKNQQMITDAIGFLCKTAKARATKNTLFNCPMQLCSFCHDVDILCALRSIRNDISFRLSNAISQCAANVRLNNIHLRKTKKPHHLIIATVSDCGRTKKWLQFLRRNTLLAACCGDRFKWAKTLHQLSAVISSYFLLAQ